MIPSWLRQQLDQLNQHPSEFLTLHSLYGSPWPIAKAVETQRAIRETGITALINSALPLGMPSAVMDSLTRPALRSKLPVRASFKRRAGGVSGPYAVVGLGLGDNTPQA